MLNKKDVKCFSDHSEMRDSCLSVCPSVRPSLWHDVRPGGGERLELQLCLRLGVERVLREAERRGPPVVGARLAGVAARKEGIATVDVRIRKLLLFSYSKISRK